MSKKVLSYITVPLVFGAVMTGIYMAGIDTIVEKDISEFKSAVVQGAPEYSYEQEMEDDSNEGEQRLPAIYAQFGEVTCTRINLQAPLYYGDTDEILEKGIGIYIGSSIPGKNSTILAGGHDTTYMAPLKDIREEDIITVTTTYGTFTYEVTGMKAANAADSSAYELENGEETLVLYTCYPFGEVEKERSKRYFVYARKLSGPALGKEVQHEK